MTEGREEGREGSTVYLGFNFVFESSGGWETTLPPPPPPPPPLAIREIPSGGPTPGGLGE